MDLYIYIYLYYYNLSLFRGLFILTIGGESFVAESFTKINYIKFIFLLLLIILVVRLGETKGTVFISEISFIESENIDNGEIKNIHSII